MTDYVFVGAGSLGRKLATFVKPVAFADRDPAKTGTFVDGVPVFDLVAAVRACPDATFVVTIWHSFSTHRILDTESELRALGVRRIVPFGHILRSQPDWGAHYFVGPVADVLADAARAAAVMNLWADASSREQYTLEVLARIYGDVSILMEPVPGPTYFPRDLFTYLGEHERVIDGGAYDGDTLQAFCDAGHTFGSWLAVEPHPVIAVRLAHRIRTFPAAAQPAIMQAALGAAPGEAWFTDDATTGAAPVGANNPSRKYQVPVERLDDFPSLQPTFIKLDIEGAELDAITGMAQTIRLHRPVMAVCVYHRPTDLWRIPLAIHALMPDAKFYLRPYDGEGWDTVMFAIPPERAL